MKSETRRETLINTLNWIQSGNAITVLKPQRKNKKNPAGYSTSKTKNKRVAGFDPSPIKTNWFFESKTESK